MVFVPNRDKGSLVYWNDGLETLKLALMISVKVERPNHSLCLIKTKFKKMGQADTSNSLVLCCLLGQFFIWKLKLFWFCTFICSLKATLAYSLSYSAQSWQKKKLSMCKLLQIQLFLQHLNQISSNWVS